MSENTQSNPQRGKYDPGWNDPPMMQYNSTSQSTGKTKLNLNKRIAFPLTGTAKPTAIVQPSQSVLPLTAIPIQNSQSQLPVAVVPPMPQTSSQGPPLMQRVPPVSSNLSSSSFNSDETNNEEIRDFCINTFQNHLGNIIENPNVRIDEIQRRINVLSQMWLNNSLNCEVRHKLLNIAKALDTRNFNEAMESYRALVVDHSNACTQWATALRQIILTIKDEIINDSLAETNNYGNILIPATAVSASSDINIYPQNTSDSEIRHEENIVSDIQQI